MTESAVCIDDALQIGRISEKGEHTDVVCFKEGGG